MTNPFTLKFDNRFATLGERFYTPMPPEGVSRDPYMISTNPAAAALIGLPAEALQHAHAAEIFAGTRELPGGKPLAMVYSGHQFGQWAGQLGDGRALLLAQVRNNAGELWDIQLKGGGKTPYSRFGDGRAVLRSCIREYLCGEAMAALHIPTTRGLCIVGTNELVLRETMEPGAVFTRLARSHVRFGHFEHFYYNDMHDELRQLADHVIEEFFDEARNAPAHQRYGLWLTEVVARTATLLAQWQAAGFCHGVMNTDNMSILGLTLDYGPFGFLERFDPSYICNHSDHHGRYAYSEQPSIALWNLYALAHALQPLIKSEESSAILKQFEPVFLTHYKRLMRAKLGIAEAERGDDALLAELLGLMREGGADYTLSFSALANSVDAPEMFTTLFHPSAREKAKLWLSGYHGRMRGAALEALHNVNPRYSLRNWVAEVAIRDAQDKGDYTTLEAVLNIISHPFDAHPEYTHFMQSAPEAYRELCVSCSS
jgi:serine/tyrosine/threonine adenylyltransferase